MRIRKVPQKGSFYQGDDRTVVDDELEQASKSRADLIAIYGYTYS